MCPQGQGSRAAGVRDSHCSSEQLSAGPRPGFPRCSQPTACSPGGNLSRGKAEMGYTKACLWEEMADWRRMGDSGSVPHRDVKGLGGPCPGG